MAPRVAKPTAPQAPQIAQTAPTPQVAKSTPPPPLVAKASEPPESGWDDAAQLPSSAVIAAADEARAVPPVVSLSHKHNSQPTRPLYISYAD